MRRVFLLLLLLLGGTARAAGLPEPAYFSDFRGQTASFSVRSITQQDNGRIWFGTDRSLYAFDGYDLIPYPCPDGHVQINTLCVLGERLLAGTNDGLYLFSFPEERYRRAAPFDRQIIRDLLPDDGQVYAATSGGLYRYDPEEDSAARLLEGDIYSLARVDGRLFVGTGTGIIVYHPDSGALTTFAPEAHLSMVMDLLPGVKGLWTGTLNRAVCLDPVSGEVLAEYPFFVVKTLCRSHDGLLLVGTDDGVFHFDPDKGRTEKLRSCVTWACIEDRDGDLWFGTEEGLLHLDKEPSFLPVDGLPSGGKTRFTSILQDRRGRLWLGGADGISMLDAEGNFRHYSIHESRFRIPHNKVSRIIEDPSSGNLYFASDGGILHLDEASGLMVPFRIPGNSNWVYDLLPRGDELWAATFEGICRIRPDGSVSARYGRQEGLSSDDIARITLGQQGRIWAMTRDQQIFRIDPEDGSVQAFGSGLSGPEDLHADSEGRIWMVGGNRLLRLTPGKELPAEVRSIEFHPDTTLESYTLNEAEGRIWICTSNGIFSVGKDSLDVHSFGTYRRYFTSTWDPDGHRLLLGAAGSVDMLRMDAAERHSQASPKPVFITGITVNDERRIGPGEAERGQIVLPESQNHLDISFSDFNFDNDIPRRFNYRLENRRARWEAPVTGNKISLAALPPGRYRLFISSANASGPDSDEVLSFRIRPPWMLSPPMLLLYLLLIGGAALGFVKLATVRRYLEMERRQRDELIEQSRAKEAFFQDVAHDFKTPLSLIIGPLGKLIKEAGPDTDVQSLRVAQENAVVLNTLIHKTIDYYKENSGITGSILPSEVEFVDFARSVFSYYQSNFPKHEFVFNSSHPEIPAVLDIVKMETVLNNLLSNACKYTPEGGSVLLSLERDDLNRQLVLKVSDTGIGIPQEEIPFAFRRYFESSRTKDGGYDSIGIGLSTIRNYVEMHGGRVSVASDEQGTTFTVLLPCLMDTESTQHGNSTAPAAEDPGKPLVAIIDDNAQICQFVEGLLRDSCRCICAHNGKSGLKLCEDVLPDLIISDVRMPVMDGLEMCRHIRRFGPLSTVPIILLTAKDDVETERQSIDLGIDVFLPKPFEVQTLTSRVHQLLGSHRRMEQQLRMEMLATPEPPRELSFDEKFLQKVTKLIEDHLDDAELSVSKLCELGGYSEKQLYRKVRQLTGQSTVEYIRTIRLKKAAALLQSGKFTVSEVLYSVGFSSASYFTRAFGAVYHMTPSEYMKSFKDK